MKRALSLLLAFQLIFLPLLVAAQSREKPVAALGRVATLGDVSEAQREIIANRLQTILSEAYDLISQEQYLKAEQAAFDSLDLEKCTEAECIRKIQEILQVERLFVLQIIREADLTQLTLNLVRLDSKRVVDGVCEKCTITQLYERIEELASDLVDQDIKDTAQELIAEQDAGEAPAQAEEDEGGISWYWWVLGGLVLAAAAAGSSSGGEPAGESCPTSNCGSVPVTY